LISSASPRNSARRIPSSSSRRFWRRKNSFSPGNQRWRFDAWRRTTTIILELVPDRLQCCDPTRNGRRPALRLTVVAGLTRSRMIRHPRNRVAEAKLSIGVSIAMSLWEIANVGQLDTAQAGDGFAEHGLHRGQPGFFDRLQACWAASSASRAAGTLRSILKLGVASRSR